MTFGCRLYNHCGDYSLKDPPVLIPNTEVKLQLAESTCRVLSPKEQIKPSSSEISSAFWFRKRPRNTYSMPSGVFLCIIRNLFRLPPIFSILSASYRDDRSLPHSIQALLCRGAFLCHRKPRDSRVVQKRLTVDLYFIFWDCRVVFNAAFLHYELKYHTLGVWFFFSYYIQNA